MAWRYRKSFKLMPGVRINLSKRGFSTTIGVRGASLNFSSRGTYLNTGIPGTGIYNRQRIDTPDGANTYEPPSSQPTPLLPDIIPAAAVEQQEAYDPNAIKSASAEEVTSEGLKGLKETLAEAYAERLQISADKTKCEKELVDTTTKYNKTNTFFGRLLRKKKLASLQAAIEDKKNEILELGEQYDLTKVELDIDIDENKAEDYKKLVSLFDAMSKSQKLWDMTSSQSNTERKSSASTLVTRRDVKFALGDIPIINSKFQALKLQNANGADMFIYPGFLVMTNGVKFGFLGVDEIEVASSISRFLEEEELPKDSKSVGTTWTYVNKDGSPDRRYSDNRQIPVMLYGEIKFSSNTGINEVYMISNAEATEQFVKAFKEYQTLFS